MCIDGCPAGLTLDLPFLESTLAQRAPGRRGTSPRKESDHVEWLSGVYDGKTTGAPIALFVRNQGHNSKPYHGNVAAIRPGHANGPYSEKYGHYDYRGGGRASARETVARVIAGAIAAMFLRKYGITTGAYLCQVGPHRCDASYSAYDPTYCHKSPLNCNNATFEKVVEQCLTKCQKEGNSVGGLVTFCAFGSSLRGLGSPVYQKVQALLAAAMCSIPAVKAFEMGEGFLGASQYGVDWIDGWKMDGTQRVLCSSRCGGVIGGIVADAHLWGRVAFKPTSSIRQSIASVTHDGKAIAYQTPQEGAHDPCVAVRGVSVVEAMLRCVLMELFLQRRVDRVDVDAP